MNTKKIIASLALSLTLISCAEQGGAFNKQGIGTILGGAGGAVLGSNIGKGHGRIAAIALGTLAGAALGNSLGSSLDKADKQYMTNTSQNTLESVPTGQTVAWKNPDSGNSGSITPTKTFQNNGKYCREYTQTVKVAGKIQQAYGQACRQADGSWQISQ